MRVVSERRQSLQESGKLHYRGLSAIVGSVLAGVNCRWSVFSLWVSSLAVAVVAAYLFVPMELKILHRIQGAGQYELEEASTGCSTRRAAALRI
jgi:hypothetical protein